MVLADDALAFQCPILIVQLNSASPTCGTSVQPEGGAHP